MAKQVLRALTTVTVTALLLSLGGCEGDEDEDSGGMPSSLGYGGTITFTAPGGEWSAYTLTFNQNAIGRNAGGSIGGIRSWTWNYNSARGELKINFGDGTDTYVVYSTGTYGFTDKVGNQHSGTWRESRSSSSSTSGSSSGASSAQGNLIDAYGIRNKYSGFQFQAQVANADAQYNAYLQALAAGNTTAANQFYQQHRMAADLARQVGNM